MRHSILLALILSISNAQASPPACKQKVWPISRDLKIPEIIGELQNLPREEVRQYAFWELAHQNPKSMDIPLLKFLAGTESDNDLAGFYGGIAVLTYGKRLEELVKGWPQRPARVQQFSEAEICKFFRKTLALKKQK